ncbi:hypothetical protein BVX98_02395 [bacterium F11]|nr:hypothetical protein BVX98_02395 [bacterium F11]
MYTGIYFSLSPKVKDFILSRKSEQINIDFISDDNLRDFPFEDLDALVCNKIPYESITALRKPLSVHIPWSGVDHIDFNFFKSDSRLSLCNSHSNADAVAEHTWAMVMDIAKKLSYNDHLMRSGDWSGRASSMGYSSRLRGKTLLIIGLGAIGTRISRFGHAFGMKIIGVKRHPATVPAGCEVETVLGHTQLETALSAADIVVVCAPLTNETRNLMGPFNLSRMKPSSLLISISRSSLVDFTALYTHLKERKIAGAAIDNWPRERMTATPAVFQEQPFHELDNIVLSPHRAFRIEESGFDQWADVLENLERVREGKNPRNVVDLELQY